MIDEDKAKLIDSLKKKIAELESIDDRRTCELRYWNAKASYMTGHTKRPKNPDYMFVNCSWNHTKGVAQQKLTMFKNVEVYDPSTNKVIIRYEENKE